MSGGLKTAVYTNTNGDV